MTEHTSPITKARFLDLPKLWVPTWIRTVSGFPSSLLSTTPYSSNSWKALNWHIWIFCSYNPYYRVSFCLHSLLVPCPTCQLPIQLPPTTTLFPVSCSCVSACQFLIGCCSSSSWSLSDPRLSKYLPAFSQLSLHVSKWIDVFWITELVKDMISANVTVVDS
jgi:hypothetical protein